MSLQASIYKTRNRATVRRRRKVTDARTVAKLKQKETESNNYTKASREATDTKMIEIQALSPTTKAGLILWGRTGRDSNSTRYCDLDEDSPLLVIQHGLG